MAANTDLEKTALRVLCCGTAEGPAKEVLAPMLRQYHWHAQLHQVIFSALLAIPSDDPEILCQLLPAKLTRMGFPDVEWSEFFAPHSLSMETAIDLIQGMVAGP